MITSKTKRKRYASALFAFIVLWAAPGASAQKYDAGIDPIVFKHLNYAEAEWRGKVLRGVLKAPYTLEIAEVKGTPNDYTHLLLKGRSVETFEKVDYDLENPAELAPGRYMLYYSALNEHTIHSVFFSVPRGLKALRYEVRRSKWEGKTGRSGVRYIVKVFAPLEVVKGKERAFITKIKNELDLNGKEMKYRLSEKESKEGNEYTRVTLYVRL